LTKYTAASVFAELVLMRRPLDEESDREARRSLLALLLDDFERLVA
jgi:hypothetical protein